VREDVRTQLRYFRDLLPFLEEEALPSPASGEELKEGES
jgi:hypothetical protein